MNRKKTLTSAQGRAGSGFAKALSMLALLLTMAAGAWAQGSGTKIYSVDFSDYTSYTFYNGSESATVENGLLVLTNSKVYTEKYEVQPEIGRPTPITAGKCYRVTIEYKTTVGGPVNVVLGAQDWSTMMGAWWVPITVSDNFQTLEATFLKCSYGATDNHILFQFGDLVGTVYIKKVEVYEFDYVNVTSVTLSSSTASVNMGDKVALTATVAPDGATEKIVKWSVGGTNADAVKLYTDEACTTEVGADATSALTVYAKGMSAGEATVTVVASSDETKSATCTVTVNPTYAITFNALNANTIEGENGKGTVTVTESDGTTAYTRNGQWTLNDEGTIVTSGMGYVIQPEIQVPENAESALSFSGTPVAQTIQDAKGAYRVEGLGQGAYAAGLHIVAVSLIEPGMVQPVPLRRVFEAAGQRGGPLEIGAAVLVGVPLGLVHELPGFDSLQLHAEGVHQLPVQSPAEAEPLGRVSHGGQLQRTHIMLHPGGGHSGLQGLLHPLLLRGAEDVYEGPIREGPQGVGGGVGPSQGVEPQPAPVDDRLPQGPEHHGAAGPPEHLGHVSGVGEGQVLEHDEVRGKGIEIPPQRPRSARRRPGRSPYGRWGPPPARTRGRRVSWLSSCRFSAEQYTFPGPVRQWLFP